MPRILVIRGGAIGDFIVTLPAIRLLREAFPAAHLEILGYKHIVSLAEGRFYAHSTRSIEYAGMAKFFIPGADLPPDLTEYFASFQQIISYLYDPDGFFEENLRRTGAKNIIAGYKPIDDTAHATVQLARPLERLALYLEDQRAVIYPGEDDRAFAREFLAGNSSPLIALHPGSGGKNKLWPLEKWADLIGKLSSSPVKKRLLLIGGEADHERIDSLRTVAGPEALLAWNLELPKLAAILEKCEQFIGHDSGISHLAAAVGTPSVALFGPTDPSVWAPVGEHVKVIAAPGGDLTNLEVGSVLSLICHK